MLTRPRPELAKQTRWAKEKCGNAGRNVMLQMRGSAGLLNVIGCKNQSIDLLNFDWKSMQTE